PSDNRCQHASSGCDASGFTGDRGMVVHRLYSHSTGPRESIEHDLTTTGEQSSAQSHQLRVHRHGWILVYPAAGLDVKLLALRQRYFEDVAVAVKPQDAV